MACAEKRSWELLLGPSLTTAKAHKAQESSYAQKIKQLHQEGKANLTLEDWGWRESPSGVSWRKTSCLPYLEHRGWLRVIGEVTGPCWDLKAEHEGIGPKAPAPPNHP